jgi:glutathione S-transferase
MTPDPWHVLTANFGEMPKPYTAFATLLDMALYLFVLINVSRARTQHKIEVPKTEGPADFQRVLRAQINTTEHLVLHLPLLWIAAYAMDDVFAALLGFIWCFGRSLYAVRYYQKAGRRLKGFAISMLANLILLLGALAGTIASF